VVTPEAVQIRGQNLKFYRFGKVRIIIVQL